MCTQSRQDPQAIRRAARGAESREAHEAQATAAGILVDFEYKPAAAMRDLYRLEEHCSQALAAASAPLPPSPAPLHLLALDSASGRRFPLLLPASASRLRNLPSL